MSTNIPQNDNIKKDDINDLNLGKLNINESKEMSKEIGDSSPSGGSISPRKKEPTLVNLPSSEYQMIRNDSPDATGGEVDSPTRAMTTVSFEDARKLEGFDLDREDNHAKIRDGDNSHVFTLGEEIDEIKCRKLRHIEIDFTGIQDKPVPDYVQPMQDPYKKATEYFAKNAILDLFGSITAKMVREKEKDAPFTSMLEHLRQLRDLNNLTSKQLADFKPSDPSLVASMRGGIAAPRSKHGGSKPAFKSGL